MKTHRQTTFLRYTEDGLIETDESIVVESSLELWLEDMHLTSFVCTAGFERELCLGHLISTGIVADSADIIFSEVSTNLCVISSKRKSALVHSFLLLRTRSFLDIPPLNRTNSTRKSIDLSLIRTSISNLQANQELHSITGAAHGALIVHTESDQFRMIEDIGRHNAVDKVIGAFASNKIDLSESILFVTGRLTSELVSKAANAKIPLMGSLTFATDLGIQIAANVGITLLGSLKRDKFWLYNQGTVLPFQN
jgi:FdhD protein